MPSTARTLLTATAEEFVWTADFEEFHRFGVTAFAVLDGPIGLQVVVDETLTEAERDESVNRVIEKLLDLAREDVREATRAAQDTDPGDGRVTARLAASTRALIAVLDRAHAA
jgi:hypothetical protein